jgi:hypothetical protein
MNGARLGIASQSLGVSEAAFRLARGYAHTREQFGAPIERLAPVAELVIEMQIRIEARRALTYETARVCDIENNTNRLLERHPDAFSADEKKEFKQRSRTLKRLNAMLTPMSKYYCSEGAIRVSTDAIQVLGGSGYMRDYAAERYYRDARITTIYEGTSQLQVVAAIKGITSGVLFSYLESFEAKTFGDTELDELKGVLLQEREALQSAVEFVKTQSGAFCDLVARKLVDTAIAVLVGHYFLAQAESERQSNSADVRKKHVAAYFITKNAPLIEMLCSQIKNGIRSYELGVMNYELLAGTVK